MREHLVPEADPEGRQIGNELHDGAVHVVQCRGIAGAVGEE